MASHCRDGSRRQSRPPAPQQMVTLRIWRGDAKGGKFEDYTTPVTEGMVVLDAVHQIQADQANDLACAGTARPASAAPARPRSTASRALMCMTQLAHLPLGPAGHRRADAGVPARSRTW